MWYVERKGHGGAVVGAFPDQEAAEAYAKAHWPTERWATRFIDNDDASPNMSDHRG